MDFKDSCEFHLSKPIEYTHKGGDPQEGSLVVLYAPTGKMFKVFIRLQQIYEQASKEIVSSSLAGLDPKAAEGLREVVEAVKESKSAEKDEDKSFTDEDANSYWTAVVSSKVDIEFFFDRFQTLMCGGCAMLEDKVAFTDVLWEKMNYRDKIRMAGWYIGNFIESSV